MRARVILVILKYWKEKPKIEAELIDAKHYYQVLQYDEKDYVLMFQIRTQVKNKGDRATTIGKATLEFTIGNHDHKITQTHIVLSDGSKARVDPNDMVTVQPNLEHYSSYDKEPKQEEIPFKLTLIHTHRKEKLEGTSKLGD